MGRADLFKITKVFGLFKIPKLLTMINMLPLLGKLKLIGELLFKILPSKKYSFQKRDAYLGLLSLPPLSTFSLALCAIISSYRTNC